MVNGQVTSGGNDQFRLSEAFVRGGQYLGDTQPDAIFWAGERYYRRQHIEIDDFYPLDISGYGAGIEDVRLGSTKLAVDYLAGARPDITTENGNYAKSNIDVRFYDVKGPLGVYGGWFDFATGKGGTTPSGTVIPTSSGEAFGIQVPTSRVARWLQRLQYSVRNRRCQQFQFERKRYGRREPYPIY